MALSGKNQRKIVALVSSRTEFRHDNLTGIAGTNVTSGRLTGDDLRDFTADMSLAYGQNRAAYVFKSYGTPIAWHVEGYGWTVPDTRYSVTTSHHQTLARVAAAR